MHDAIHAGERTVQCVRRTHRAQETPLNARHPWRLHRCAIFGSPSMRSAAAECRPKTLWPVLAATLHAERWSPLLIRAGVCVVHMALVWRGVAWCGVTRAHFPLVALRVALTFVVSLPAGPTRAATRVAPTRVVQAKTGGTSRTTGKFQAS